MTEDDALGDCDALRNPIAESSRLEESLFQDESYSRLETSSEVVYNDDRPGTNSVCQNQSSSCSRDSHSGSRTPEHSHEQEDPKKVEQLQMEQLAQLSTDELMEKVCTCCGLKLS